MNIESRDYRGSYLQASYMGRYGTDLGWQELMDELTPSQKYTANSYGFVVMISSTGVPYVMTLYMASNIGKVVRYRNGRYRTTTHLAMVEGCVTIYDLPSERRNPAVLLRSVMYRLKSYGGEKYVTKNTSYATSILTIGGSGRLENYRTYTIMQDDCQLSVIMKMPRAIDDLMKETGVRVATEIRVV